MAALVPWLLALAAGVSAGPLPVAGTPLPLRRAAERGEASFHTEVPPRAWRALRLENLPAGTTVSARVQATDAISIALVREHELRLYPNAGPPVFRGRAQNRLDFRVMVPDTGTWALVLDNRAGGTFVKVDLDVEAVRPGARPRATPPEAAPPTRDEPDGAGADGREAARPRSRGAS